MDIKYKKEFETDLSVSGEKLCEICNKSKAHYTCPRCNIAYCNLNCYKNEKHLRCSENFYRDQVITELKGLSLESNNESKSRMVDILKREMDNMGNEEVLPEEESYKNIENISEQEMFKVYKKQVENWKAWWKSEKFKKELVKEIGDAKTSNGFKYNTKLIKNSTDLNVLNASEFIYNDMLKLAYSYLILAYVYQLDDDLGKDLSLIDEIVFNLIQINHLIDSNLIKSLDLKSRFCFFIKLLLEEENLFLKSYINKKFLVNILDDLNYIVENPKLLTYIFSKLYDLLRMFVARKNEKELNLNKENLIRNKESDAGEIEEEGEEEEEKPINVFHMNSSKPKLTTKPGKKSRVQIINKRTTEQVENLGLKTQTCEVKAAKIESPNKKDCKLYLKKLEFYFKWFIINEKFVRSSSNIESIVNELNIVKTSLGNEIKEFEAQKEFFEKNLNYLRQTQIKSEKLKIEEI